MFNCQFSIASPSLALEVQVLLNNGILGITGASGVGKTTFLKHLIGLHAPQNGFIQLNQKFLFVKEQGINLPPQQRKIAMVFQQPHLFPHLNVWQNLSYAKRWQKQPIDANHTQAILDVLDLHHLTQRRIQQLSGGEAQRVALARALLAQPQLLLLDEPLTGLHPDLKHEVLCYLKQIQVLSKIPMLYVTHHIEELKCLDAQHAVVNSGQLIFASSDS